MRFAALTLLAGCSFSPAASAVDGPITTDSPTTIDAMIDAPTGGRITSGLVGLWSFDDGSGSAAVETSGVTPPVTLLAAHNDVAWDTGTMIVSSALSLTSSGNDALRLNQACVNAKGVTLEAWVTPMSATEGTATAPATVATIDSSIVSRNIGILQVGNQWLGRVRTNTTDPDWANGGPDLLGSATDVVVTTGMTHVVVVADTSERALYVNGQKIAETAPEGPAMWGGDYKMVLANDNNTFQRSWLGTYALVALYDRALTSTEIQTNFTAGP